MNRLAPLLSSQRDDWETPRALFEVLDAEFRFDLDPAASPTTAKCARWYGPGSPLAEDGLSAPWSGRVFLNPPYGTRIARWVEAAHRWGHSGACEVVVALLPARTDTLWFHRHVLRAGEIRFIRGRLTFEGGPYPAPFPSMIVIWRPGDGEQPCPRVVGWDWRQG